MIWLYWIIASIFFAFIELFTTSFFIIWFSLGALCAMFVSLMNFSITIQVITFFIVSILLLIYTRPLAKKFIEPKKDYKSNTDKLIGKEAIVIENINNIKDTGQVKIKGEIWSASSESDEIIQKNSIVIIERVQGVTLIVKNKNN